MRFSLLEKIQSILGIEPSFEAGTSITSQSRLALAASLKQAKRHRHPSSADPCSCHYQLRLGLRTLGASGCCTAMCLLHNGRPAHT